MVPSKMLSPIWGIMTSTAMTNPPITFDEKLKRDFRVPREM
jgi:hypothetical protein